VTETIRDSNGKERPDWTRHPEGYDSRQLMTGEQICRRCTHPQSWHRHDDEARLSKHPQPCAPAGCGPIHLAPFRCLGYDCERAGFPGGTPETRCGCPNFERNCDGY
jgi:hypothetical protein